MSMSKIKRKLTSLVYALVLICPWMTAISFTHPFDLLHRNDYCDWQRSVSFGEQNAEQFPEFGKDGLYHITNAPQYRNFVEGNKKKLIVIKYFAPWCRSCKGLAPKFIKLARDPKYKELPILWAELNVKDNKHLVKSLGVKRIPSIQFYALNGRIVDTFGVTPSMMPLLRSKLDSFIADEVMDGSSIADTMPYLESLSINNIATYGAGMTSYLDTL